MGPQIKGHKTATFPDAKKQSIFMSETVPSLVPSEKAGPLMLNETKALWALWPHATCARAAASQRGCFHLS